MDEQTARHYLADALAEALFTRPGPTRLWDLLAALPEDSAMSPAAAVSLLQADPRFAPCETRWDLAHRRDLGERPLGGALQAILQAFGRPMPMAALIAELCVNKTGDPEQFRELLVRHLTTSRDVACDGDYYYLQRWLVNTAASEDQRLFYLNGLDKDPAFQKALKKLTAPALKGRQVLDTAEAVLKAYGQPLDNRALGLVLWRLHGERFDAAEVLSDLTGDERFLPLSGPQWVLSSQWRVLQKAMAKVVGAPETPPDPADIAAVLVTPVAQRMRLSDEMSRSAQQIVQRSMTPVALDELLADVMHLRPKQRNFAPAAHALEELLNNDLRLWKLERGRYLARHRVPEWVRSVPAGLVPETIPTAPREVNPDVLLTVEDLPPELVEAVRSPFYEDQGDTEVMVAEEAVSETRIPVLYHHYRLGTLKQRLYDRRVLHVPGPVTVANFHLPEGGSLPVWINSETRLLYGFLGWFEANLPPSGGLLTLKRLSEAGDEFEVVYAGETDPATLLAPERLNALLDLGQRLRRRRAFLLEIVTELLQVARGLTFDQLWSEANVIRRVSRLQVASILAHYEQFELGSHHKWQVGKSPRV